MLHQAFVPREKSNLFENIQLSEKRTQILCWLLPLLTITLITICIWISYVVLGLPLMESSASIKLQPQGVDSSIEHQKTWVYESKKKEDIGRYNTTYTGKNDSSTLSNRVVVCYYTVPNQVQAHWQLRPLDINPHICTHIIVGFASVVNCTLSLGEATSIFAKVVELKSREPKLKVMVSVGGMNEQNVGFSEMVENHMNRKRFIRSVLKIINVLKLDGLDLDWEFPAWLTNNKYEKIRFVQLIQELRKEFNRIGQELIISVAVAAPQAIIDQSYDVPDIAQYVDFVNLMAYDYHFYQWYFPVTALNAPLYSRTSDTGYLSNLNVNFSAHYWITKMMPPEKLVVGIPTYGHSYHLVNPENHDLDAPTLGFGNIGHNGFVNYSAVCYFLQSGGRRIFEREARVPYTYKDFEWISYDDIESIYYKVQWIRSNNFKGAMIFSLNEDDWNGTCVVNEKFPLTSLVWNMLR